MLSQAVEDYVKAIFKLQQGDNRVTTSALAERLGVSAASASNMMKKLAEMDLVYLTPYHGAELTPAGLQVALEVLRHHRLLERYLAEMLGFGWDEVHAEAERLEHVISEKLETKIAEALGHPTTDPHGAPIPTPDGRIEALPPDRLTDLEVGQTAIVRYIDAGDPALLRYLATLGLGPEVTVEVVAKAPFQGPLRLRVGEHEHAVGDHLARNVYVSQIQE